MAFGDNSIFNTTKTAAVFNQMARDRFVQQMRKESALANVAFGLPKEVDGQLKFTKDGNYGGNQIEIPAIGSLRTISGVVDGTAELANATITPLTSLVNYTFEIGHYAHTLGVPNAELRKVQLGQKKAGDLIETYFRILMDSYIESISTDLNGTGAGVGDATNRVMSWVHAVSDGTSTGETNYALYGKVNRADAANGFAKAIFRPTVGTLSLAKIAEAQIAAQGNGANSDLGICGSTVFGLVRQLVEGQAEAITTDRLTDFGRAQFRYAGTNFALEFNCPAQTLGLLDTSTWLVKRGQEDFSKGIMINPVAVAGHVLPTEMFIGVYTDCPNKNVKMNGITG